jgi:hypothetical protein
MENIGEKTAKFLLEGELIDGKVKEITVTQAFFDAILNNHKDFKKICLNTMNEEGKELSFKE